MQQQQQMPSAPLEEAVTSAAQIIAQDTVDLACAFIQKTAVEKAIPEMDKRLKQVGNKQVSLTSGKSRFV